jgi:membrane-associated phospholipid phosphatase
MMLLGSKPRRRSFPSGHAGHLLRWRLGARLRPAARTPVFLGLAALVSMSGVYLGSHGPGEILTGSLLGVALAEVLRRPTERLLACVDLPEGPRAAGFLVKRQEPER